MRNSLDHKLGGTVPRLCFTGKNCGEKLHECLLSFVPSDLVVVITGESSVNTCHCRNKLNDMKEKTRIFRYVLIAVVVAIQLVAKYGFNCITLLSHLMCSDALRSSLANKNISNTYFIFAFKPMGSKGLNLAL